MEIRNEIVDRETFKKNFEMFFERYPYAYRYLHHADTSSLHFSRNSKGELNLYREVQGQKEYLYNPQDIAAEVVTWKSQFFCELDHIIFIYGLGLGYYNEGLKEWKEKDPDRLVVFVEDDPAVLLRFLETTYAEKILHDPQVEVRYFSTEDIHYKDSLFDILQDIVDGYCEFRHSTSVLNSYRKRDRSESVPWNIYLKMFSDKDSKRYSIRENVFQIIQNDYQNLYSYADTYHLNCLKDKFKNIPVILCGAGPSLSLHLERLKKVDSRALIIPSGSAVAVMSRQGIPLHAVGGIDHTDVQGSRYLNSYAFEVPMMYQMRFYPEALEQHQGMHFYVNQEDFHNTQMAPWFDKKLSLDFIKEEIKGISTTNHLLYDLVYMGCHPIIMVGMDLCFTEKKRYAKEIAVHPSDAKRFHEQVSSVPKTHVTEDLYGNRVYTNVVWLIESHLLTEFIKDRPETLFLNATEGGVPILGVPNVTFEEVESLYLNKQYDLENQIFVESQQSSHFTITLQEIEDLLKVWKQQVEKCREVFEEALQDEEIDESQKLENVEAYRDYFAEINNQLIKYQAFRLSRDARLGKDISRFRKNRLEALNDFTQFHLEEIGSVLAAGFDVIENLAETVSFEGLGGYHFENGIMAIHDEEMGIDIVEDTKPYGKRFRIEESRYHASEQLKSAIGYLDQRLHGPVRWYSLSGRLISECWYLNGKRMGKGFWRYKSGKLASIRRFRDGLQDGMQEYWDENGRVRSKIPYRMGKFHGAIKLFHSNGKPKRLFEFKEGNPHGIEKAWDRKGNLRLEIEYLEGRPFGTARRWFSNGKLEREVIYHEIEGDYDVFEYDKEGNLVKKFIHTLEKPHEYTEKRSEDLETGFKDLQEKLEELQKRLDGK